LLVSQQLATIDRMHRTYGFLQTRVRRHRRRNRDWWFGQEFLE
jgi:hypothetical protein